MMRLVALVLAICTLACDAFAWTHGSPLTPREVAVNLAPLTGREGAFINILKNCGSLSSTSGYAFPLILDTNGYPTSTPTNDLTCTIASTAIADNPEWTVGWSGTLRVRITGPSGTITVTGGGTCTVVTQASSTITFEGTNCSSRFTFGAAPTGSLTITFPNAGTYTSPSGLYMVRSDEKTIFDSGEIFRPISAGTLLATLKDMRVSVVRFLDWNQIADGNDESQWNFLAPTTAFFYGGTRWEPTVFGATAITGTDTYAGPATAASPSVYVDGQVYQNIVTNANTSTTPTLSVGGGTAKTIVNKNAAVLSVGFIAANSLGTFVYNAKLDKWVYNSAGLQGRVPVPIVTALCNKVATVSAYFKGCWYQIPQFFTAASIVSYTQHVRDNLTSTLKAYFEYSNELFNTAASPQPFAQVVGTARSFPDTLENYKDEFALNHRVTMGIVTDNWSPRSAATLVRVMSWAVFEQPAGKVNQGQNVKLNSSGNYDAVTPTVDYSVAGTCTATVTTSGRPVDCTDAYAYAPYYNGAQIAGPADANWGTSGTSITQAVNAADNYANGLTSTALDWVDCDVRGVPTATYPNCGYRGATFTGSISGTTLTVSSVNGTIVAGQTVFGATAGAVTANTTISSGAGATWTVNNSQTVGSQTMTSGTLGLNTFATFNKVNGTYDLYNQLATTWGKYVISYEGGYVAFSVSAARLAAMTFPVTSSANCGTAACVSAEFSVLIEAYKNDARFATLTYDQFAQEKLYANFRIPAWYFLGPTTSSSALVFSIYSGATILIAPYQSYTGIKNFASGQ